MFSTSFQNQRGPKDGNASSKKSQGPTVPAIGQGLSILNNLQEYRIVRFLTPHFDTEYYLSQCFASDDISNPVQHYVRVGAALGLDPSREFSTRHYVDSNVDVARSGVNPFWHYLKYGKAERREALPSSNLLPNAESVPIETVFQDLVAEKFDAEFYAQSYPDLPESDQELLEHFLTIGWLLGYDPNDWFSTREYLLANPDVAVTRENPFNHYLLHGISENRPLQVRKEPADVDFATEIARAMDVVSSEFDPDFYASTYPDVVAAGVDPLFHYCAEGHREGRDPSAEFCTSYYLESNPDVAAAGMNPFVHYVQTGRNEGRFPAHPGGDKIKTLTRYSTLDDLVAEWTTSGPLPDLMDRDELRQALADLPDAREVLLSISHDDHREHPGGIQLCIQREEEMVVNGGGRHLAVFPLQPLPRLARKDAVPDVSVAIRLDGQFIGATSSKLLASVLGKLLKKTPATAVVHQLLGHNPEQVAQLIASLGQSECLLWLHDYVTLCPNFTLQRNKIDYCGAPGSDSGACGICIFGAERADHEKRMAAFFDKVDVHVIAPSAAAQKVFDEKGALPAASISVQPHLTLKWRKRSKPLQGDADRPVRIGFVGSAMVHKGWNEFQSLVKDRAKDGVEFFYFGSRDQDLKGATFVPVHVTANDGNRMITELSEKDIDFVLHWANWPETFSLTTFEAMAAGAFVITNKVSGNVAASVRKHRRGAVLDSWDDLQEFFQTDEFRTLLDRRRDRHQRYRAVVTESQLSIDALKVKEKS